MLTPHAGELGAAARRESSWVDAHRLAALRRAVERFGCVVLLKGPTPSSARRARACSWRLSGPPSLATAGTGDVLTGVLAAFLAKGLEPRFAAAAAAVAQQAARVGARTAGSIASDVVAALPGTLDEHAPL